MVAAPILAPFSAKTKTFREGGEGGAGAEGRDRSSDPNCNVMAPQAKEKREKASERESERASSTHAIHKKRGRRVADPARGGKIGSEGRNTAFFIQSVAKFG